MLLKRDASSLFGSVEWVIVPLSSRTSGWDVVDVGSKRRLQKRLKQEKRLLFVNSIMQE